MIVTPPPVGRAIFFANTLEINIFAVVLLHRNAIRLIFARNPFMVLLADSLTELIGARKPQFEALRRFSVQEISHEIVPPSANHIWLVSEAMTAIR